MSITIHTKDAKIIKTSLASIKCSHRLMAMRMCSQVQNKNPDIIKLLQYDESTLSKILEWTSDYQKNSTNYGYSKISNVFAKFHYKLTDFDKTYLEKYSQEWFRLRKVARELYIMQLVQVFDTAIESKNRLMKMQENKFKYADDNVKQNNIQAATNQHCGNDEVETEVEVKKCLTPLFIRKFQEPQNELREAMKMAQIQNNRLPNTSAVQEQSNAANSALQVREQKVQTQKVPVAVKQEFSENILLEKNKKQHNNKIDYKFLQDTKSKKSIRMNAVETKDVATDVHFPLTIVKDLASNQQQNSVKFTNIYIPEISFLEESKQIASKLNVFRKPSTTSAIQQKSTKLQKKSILKRNCRNLTNEKAASEEGKANVNKSSNKILKKTHRKHHVFLDVENVAII